MLNKQIYFNLKLKASWIWDVNQALEAGKDSERERFEEGY